VTARASQTTADVATTQAAAPVRSAPREPLADRGTAASRLRSEPVRFAGAVAFLALATWLYQGYSYEVWPQPAFLDATFRMQGELPNDWATGFPAGHWFVVSMLGLLPGGLTEVAVGGAYLLFLVTIWGAFVSICRSLGAGIGVAVAAGLVAIPTRLRGFGVSDTLLNCFYPNTLSFGLAAVAVALLLRGHLALTGAALGASTLVHPGMGPLMVAAIAPVVLLPLVRRRGWREALRFVVPLAVLAVPSLLHLVFRLTAGASLTAGQQFDFLTVVRIPHHVLYSAFPAAEWAQTGVWTAVLLVSLWIMRRDTATRTLAMILAISTVLCALGAIASAIGWPVALVSAQTSRLSALVVLLGLVAAAGALSRLAGTWAVALLMGVFLVGPIVLRLPVVGSIDALTISGVEGALVLVLLGALAFPRIIPQPPTITRLLRTPRLATAATTAAVAVGFASLVILHAERVPPPTAEAVAFSDIADNARALTPPDENVMVPPDADGFRTLSRRGDIVEWGGAQFGRGDLEWRQRLLDLTQNPAVLDPGSVGTDVAARTELIADSYDAAIGASAYAPCKYGTRHVVARTTTRVPNWYVVRYANASWRLLELREGTCENRGLTVPRGGTAAVRDPVVR
jgi:hypothetical protein